MAKVVSSPIWKTFKTDRIADIGRKRAADKTLHADNESSRARRHYGFNMSTWISVAVGAGAVLMLVIVIILSETLSGTAAQSSYVH